MKEGTARNQIKGKKTQREAMETEKAGEGNRAKTVGISLKYHSVNLGRSCLVSYKY